MAMLKSISYPVSSYNTSPKRSNNPKMQYTALNRGSDIGFGARKTFGTPGDENPLECFFNYVKTCPDVSVPPFSKEQIARLHESIVNLIRQLEFSRGVLDPDIEICPQEANPIDHQSTDLPPCLSENLRELDKLSRSLEQGKWLNAGQLMQQRYADKIDQFHANIMSCDPKSAEFVDRLIELNSFLANGMEVEMNTDNNELKNLVESDEATIFLFNHPCPPFDLSVSFGFLAELYKEYKEAGKAETCPRPKYILTERIPGSFCDKFREVFEKMEAVGVDAGTYPTADRANTNKEKLAPVIEGFLNDDNHIFIFPEGGRPRYKDTLSLKERFQYGIAKIIKKAAREKGSVRVVSVGLDYKDGVGAVHIGKPVYYKSEGNKIRVSKGSITPGSKPAAANTFYQALSKMPDDQVTLPLCIGGKELDESCKKSDILLSRLVAGTLCSNLDVAVDAASASLQNVLSEKGKF